MKISLMLLAAVCAWPQTPVLPQVGQPAPPFRFADILSAGAAAPASLEALTPERLRGTVVVLDFFATWCAPCVASIPRTNALIDATADLPVIHLAVTTESREVISNFLADHPFKATVVADFDEATTRAYFLRSLPFVVVIDRQGRVSTFTHPLQIDKPMILKALNEE